MGLSYILHITFPEDVVISGIEILVSEAPDLLK